jgi:hypothetical protein
MFVLLFPALSTNTTTAASLSTVFARAEKNATEIEKYFVDINHTPWIQS